MKNFVNIFLFTILINSSFVITLKCRQFKYGWVTIQEQYCENREDSCVITVFMVIMIVNNTATGQWEYHNVGCGRLNHINVSDEQNAYVRVASCNNTDYCLAAEEFDHDGIKPKFPDGVVDLFQRLQNTSTIMASSTTSTTSIYATMTTPIATPSPSSSEAPNFFNQPILIVEVVVIIIEVAVIMFLLLLFVYYARRFYKENGCCCRFKSNQESSSTTTVNCRYVSNPSHATINI